MDLVTYNPKEYTVEQLNALREDLRKLMSKVDVELKERESARFEELVKNVVDAIAALTHEYPNWSTNYDFTLCGEMWEHESMCVSDFFLEGD